jgi:hypothetical protein
MALGFAVLIGEGGLLNRSDDAVARRTYWDLKQSCWFGHGNGLFF